MTSEARQIEADEPLAISKPVLELVTAQRMDRESEFIPDVIAPQHDVQKAVRDEQEILKRNWANMHRATHHSLIGKLAHYFTGERY